MTTMRTWTILGLITSWAAATGGHRAVARGPAADVAQKKTERARVVFSHDLAPLNGDNLSVTIVEVNYGPGESSAPHSHPCPVIGYIVEGALRFQVKGQAEAVYKAGESFYEAANGVHQVSANASDKQPAKLLAYFVCDHHAPLSVEVPEDKPAGGR